jgi:tellurite resistance protein TerC
MLLIASWVIQNRWLLLLGGFYLIKLAVEHLGETPAEARAAAARGTGQPTPRLERGFWGVVLAVELADLAFSLDNVVAAVALSRQLWVVMAGVFLGIVTMRFAAGIFSYLIARYPVLEATAYLLMLTIGLELVAEDLFHIRVDDLPKFMISLGTFALSLIYGQLPALQRIGRRMVWLKRALGAIDLLFVYVLKPVSWIVHGAGTGLRATVAAVRARRQAADPTSRTRDR